MRQGPALRKTYIKTVETETSRTISTSSSSNNLQYILFHLSEASLVLLSSTFLHTSLLCCSHFHNTNLLIKQGTSQKGILRIAVSHCYHIIRKHLSRGSSLLFQSSNSSSMPTSSGRTSSSSRSRSEPRASSQPRVSSSTRGNVSPFARRDNPPPYAPEGGSWPRRNPPSPERVRFTGGFPSNPQVPETYGTAPPGSRERDDRYRNDLRERGIEKKGNYSKSHEDYKDAELYGEVGKARYSEHMGTARKPPSREDRRGDPRGAWTGQPLEKPSWHGAAAPLAADVASAYGK